MSHGDSKGIEKVNLPANWNPRLINHMAEEIAIIILLLSQIAKLESSISKILREENCRVEAMET